jgi:hypothetical protein
VPFAHWLVAEARPSLLVELGTHAGVSYAAFCQAVQRAGLATQCSAVDTWAGDDHAGAYEEAVYADLKAFNDARFACFSKLIRSTFDDALPTFADGSIDLLHIDGFHSYEAVSHDFHSWRPKLSNRAVVLFHDTCVRERGFGVWRFWDEIRGSGVASMEFTHSSGLGVLALGPDAATVVLDLCAAPIERVRTRFAALGERHVLAFERSRQGAITVAAPIEEIEPDSPLIDAALKLDKVFIAERFAGPAGLCALRLPPDAVTRGAQGCTVWVISADGRDWRQGDVITAPKGSITLGFAGFGHPMAQYFHLFVTARCPKGAGLPSQLAALLRERRPPIVLETPAVAAPATLPHALTVLADPTVRHAGLAAGRDSR